MLTCFLVLFDLNTLIYPFTLKLCLSLKKRCFSCTQQIDGFLILSARLYLWVGELRSLVFTVITVKYVLTVVIVLLILMLLLVSSVYCNMWTCGLLLVLHLIEQSILGKKRGYVGRLGQGRPGAEVASLSRGRVGGDTMGTCW